MVDNKKEEKKDEKVYKFKPIIATAKKLPPIDGQDVLEINVPIEEDSDALVNEATKRDKRDNKRRDSKLLEKEGDLNMDEATVETLVNKKLLDMDIQKTIKDIGTVTVKTHDNVKAVENRLGSYDELFENLKEQQKEACTGVGCVKDEIENIKKETSSTREMLTDIAKKLENINGRTEKIDDKTERINKRTETEKAICSGKTGCGAEIIVGSSYCPNCRKEIDSWEGMPDWVPHSRRKQ